MSEGIAEDEIRHPTKELTVGEEIAIEMVAVHKWYGQFHVLKDINLTVHKGERIVVCGPSGSGKSTLIRCINRLEEHQKGKIVVRRQRVDRRPEEHRARPPRGRHGVPAVQPVSQPHRPGKLLVGADLGAQYAQGRGRGTRHGIPGAGQDTRTGAQVSGPAFRRSAAARGDRAVVVHEPQDHAVRRADLGARPRDDQGGAST